MKLNSGHFLSFGERRSIKSGMTIVDGVDINKQWFYVDKGMVKVELNVKNGNDRIYYYKDAGHVIDSKVINSFCESLANLVAVEDCDIYLLSRSEFHQRLSEDFALA